MKLPFSGRACCRFELSNVTSTSTMTYLSDQGSSVQPQPEIDAYILCFTTIVDVHTRLRSGYPLRRSTLTLRTSSHRASIHNSRPRSSISYEHSAQPCWFYIYTKVLKPIALTSMSGSSSHMSHRHEKLATQLSHQRSSYYNLNHPTEALLSLILFKEYGDLLSRREWNTPHPLEQFKGILW